MFMIREMLLCFLFFFSSRRRHTRSKRDWSSDVCSSDLRPVNSLQSCANVDLEDILAQVITLLEGQGTSHDKDHLWQWYGMEELTRKNFKNFSGSANKPSWILKSSSICATVNMN